MGFIAARLWYELAIVDGDAAMVVAAVGIVARVAVMPVPPPQLDCA
jgi:membrane protein involved in colicin uptake